MVHRVAETYLLPSDDEGQYLKAQAGVAGEIVLQLLILVNNYLTGGINLGHGDALVDQ